MIFQRAALLQTQHFLTRSHTPRCGFFLRRMHFPVLVYFFVVSRHDRVPVSRLSAQGFATPSFWACSKADSMQIPRHGSDPEYLNFVALRWLRSPRRPTGSRRTRARFGPPLLEKSIHEIRVFKNLSSYVRSLVRFLVKRGGVKISLAK